MAQHNRMWSSLLVGALLALSAPQAIAAAGKSDPAKVLLVKRQYTKAAKALMAAAEAGDAKAQYQLASLYRLGLGVEADKAKAIAWYRKAAAQGDAKAARVLKRIDVAIPATEKKAGLRNVTPAATPLAAALDRLPERQAPAQDWLALAAARNLAPAVVALLQGTPAKAPLALAAAAEGNRPDMAAAAVASGAPATVKVKGEETALSLAVRPGREKLLSSLLAPPATAQISPEDAAQALTAAAQACNDHALQALSNAFGATPAASTAAIDVVASCNNAEALLPHLNPALLSTPDALGRNSMWHAARSGADAALAWLLAAHVDPLSPDKSGITSAHAAALAARPEALSRIIRLAPPVRPSQDGLTPLMLASFSGCTDCITQLLATGEDVNAKDEAGNTALMYAVRARQTEAIRALLKAGANDAARNENSDTPAKLYARLRKT